MDRSGGSAVTPDLRAVVVGAIAMAIIVYISNRLVFYPINDWLTWAAFTYPFAFLVTDLVNRRAGSKAGHLFVLLDCLCRHWPSMASMGRRRPRRKACNGAVGLVALPLDCEHDRSVQPGNGVSNGSWDDDVWGRARQQLTTT